MSWYRQLTTRRRQGQAWAAAQLVRVEEKFGIRLRLPDSWFVLTLTIALALTTWWLQQFVAQMPLWQQISQRQIALTMNHVTILSYRDGVHDANTRAESLTLASRQAPQNQAATPAATFEHWQMAQWQSWQRQGTQVYFIRAPLALLTHETQTINLSGGVQVLGFKPWVQNTLRQSIQDTTPFHTLAALANLSLSTPSATYLQSSALIQMPEQVLLTLEQSALQGDNMVVNLQESKLTLNHVTGQFLGAANEHQ